MADFKTAHQATMGNEGGANFNAADKGNVLDKGGVVTIPTYKGIAPTSWPQWGGWKYITGAMVLLNTMPAYGTGAHTKWVSHLNSKLAELTSLQQMVLDFYQKNFWDKYRLSEVSDQTVATWLYDHVVNGGARGAMWMQEAAGVTADGAIGPKSLAAINAADPVTLLQEAEDVAAFYRLDKAAADPSQIQFLPSWLRRDGVSAEEIKQVMQMARDGLTYAEVAQLKEMIKTRA